MGKKMLLESYFLGKESHLIRESQFGHPWFKWSLDYI